VAAVFILQLVLFQLAEEIGFTGFLQHHWQDRYHSMKLALYGALLWALWRMPDHFAEAGWGVEALISVREMSVLQQVGAGYGGASRARPSRGDDGWRLPPGGEQGTTGGTTPRRKEDNNGIIAECLPAGEPLLQRDTSGAPARCSATSASSRSRSNSGVDGT
jgi:hypothetical protein